MSDPGGAAAPLAGAAVPRVELRCPEFDPFAEPTAGTAAEPHPLADALARARGVGDGPDWTAFFAPKLGHLRPPSAMAGFEQALDLLTHARTKGLRVGVFGDYDVDGVSTAAILTTYLEAVGVEVVARVAHRDRGYGLGIEDCEAMREAGVRVVVTGDLGTSDVEALAWLREHDMLTAVIDHHYVPTTLPPTNAFINPHQDGCGFPFKGLCSAGVAFYLCAGLRSALSKQGVSSLPDPRAWLDLVAIATVCDMMPLRAENRVLVSAGLRHLSRRTRPGLRALLAAAGVDEAVAVDEEHVGFKIGPRLNSPGRLGSAEPSLQLLRARTATEAKALADKVEMLNARRKRHTEQTVTEALALLLTDPMLEQRAGLVVAHDGWLPGVVGIAANGVVEQHGRPAAVLAVDREANEARGSVRSTGGADVRAALEACEPLLTRFGGHREAAGLSLRADHVDAFTEAFDVAIAEQGSAVGTPEDVETVDAELPLVVIDEELIAGMRAASPFGVGHEAPRFIARGLTVARVRVLKERHLAMTFRQEDARAEAIAFGQASHAPSEGDRVDCIFVPVLDRFRGETRLKLHIQRFWASSL